MSWGVWGKNFSTKEMTSLIDFCVENGNATFDHADIYGGYTTEAAFGKAFAESSVKREAIQLITKCGIQYVTEARNNKVKHYNYSKDYIIWSVEESLKNLQTEYLDVFLLHRPSPLMHPDEIKEAITLLQQQGKIIDFGVSNFTPSQMELLKDDINLTTNQIEFSLVQHNAMNDGTLDYLFKNKIQPMCWSPLGKFFGLDTEQSQRIAKELTVFAEKYNVSKDQLLLAWILQHPSGVIPVIGSANKERIQKANAAKEIQLELEDWFILYQASMGHKVA